MTYEADPEKYTFKPATERPQTHVWFELCDIEYKDGTVVTGWYNGSCWEGLKVPYHKKPVRWKRKKYKEY